MARTGAIVDTVDIVGRDASLFMPSNMRNAGAGCDAYAASDVPPMCASNIDSATTIATAGAGPSIAAPRTARYATGTTRGSAYRVVIVSWNTRSKTRYGPNATASAASAGERRRSVWKTPSVASTSTMAATAGRAHGETNA
jgi:hypothetical protein